MADVLLTNEQELALRSEALRAATVACNGIDADSVLKYAKLYFDFLRGKSA